MRPLLITLVLLCAVPASARGGHGGGHSSYGGRSYSRSSSSRTTRAPRAPKTTRSYRTPRRSHSERKRSVAAKDAFKRQQPCPSTARSSGRCPGYVVDHRVALACGGADDPSNMQWQTTTAARLKDKTERKGCR